MANNFSGDYRFAGFWWRFLAYFIDGFFLLLISSVINMTYGFTGVLLHMNPETVGGMSFLTGGISGWLYYTIMESSRCRATPGKMICGMIVVDMEGNRISFGRANGRYFAKILSILILFFGYFMIGWTAKKQGLHDMIAGTLVLRRTKYVDEKPVVVPDVKKISESDFQIS